MIFRERAICLLVQYGKEDKEKLREGLFRRPSVVLHPERAASFLHKKPAPAFCLLKSGDALMTQPAPALEVIVHYSQGAEQFG